MLGEYFQALVGFFAIHGYVALFLGLFLEAIFVLGLFVPGLTVLTIAGVAAGDGRLDPFLGSIVAVLGIVTGDGLMFLLARQGVVRISKISSLAPRIAGAQNALDSEAALLYLFHFPMYMRMVLPAVAGLGRMRYRTFVRFDLVGATLFVLSVGGAGYLFGQVLGVDPLLDRVTELLVIFAALYLILVVRAAVRVRRMLRSPSADQN